jgi:DNA-binding NtrC family response regulator
MSRSPGERAATILLADDDELLLEVTGEFLESLGYRVIVVRDGREALGHYRNCRDEIALAVFDVMMPRMSGAEAALKIRESNPEQPIVFVTGYSHVNLLAHEQFNRLCDVLHKPVDFDRFRSVIQCMMHGETETRSS